MAGVTGGGNVADYWDTTDIDWTEDDYNKYKDATKFEDLAARLQQHALSGEHYDDKAVLMLTVESVHNHCVGCWVNVPYTANFPALCEIDHGEYMWHMFIMFNVIGDLDVHMSPVDLPKFT